MSIDAGAQYRPNPDEQDLLARVIVDHSGADPGVIRPAIASSWALYFERDPGPDQHDWFDFVAAIVAAMPTQAQQATREVIMQHAEQTGHSVRIVQVLEDRITVACLTCGAFTGPYAPIQSL